MRAHHRRRIVLIVGALLILVAGLVFGWRLWSTRGYHQAEGIYLADGGQSFIEIRAGHFGGLRVTDGYVQATASPGLAPVVTAEAQYQFGELTIVQEEVFDDHDPGVYKGTLFLRLARGTDGDWDLDHAVNSLTIDGSLGEICALLWGCIVPWDYDDLERVAELVYVYMIKKTPIAYYALPRSAPPIGSFLHRIDDRRIPEYFELRRRWDDPKSCLQLIRAICADHPNDRFLMLHLAELEAIAGDFTEARDVYARWKKRYRKGAGPLLSVVADRAWQAIQRVSWEDKYPLLPHHSAFFAHPDTAPKPPLSPRYDRTLEGLMRFVRDRSKAEGIRFSENPIVMTAERIRKGMLREIGTSFLTVQVSIKTARIMAMLALLRGEREKALELLMGAYRFGQDLNVHNEFLITKLIGIAARQIAVRGLAIYALSACETEQELGAFAERLDRMAAEPGQPRADQLMLGDMSALQNLMTERSGMYVPDDLEAATRHRVADARMANLRAAAHARLQFLRTGEFPKSTGELAALFPDGPPLDPFTSNTLSILCVPTTRGCTVYSVGPDRIDQKAAIEYDPTNGTMSEGDVSLTVPREREYPFPRSGLHAASARDVVETFPNGLPLDPFSPYGKAYRGNNPRDRDCGNHLAILDATTSTPVVVFSVGPDLDELGPTSRTLWSFPVPAGQPVYRRAFSEPARPGYYVLQPLYDPTNGTTSKGDLFVEIPRP